MTSIKRIASTQKFPTAVEEWSEVRFSIKIKS